MASHEIRAGCGREANLPIARVNICWRPVLLPTECVRKEQHVQTPLIMAVEPDPRQAAQLSALFRRQFQAELVLAGSTAAAMAQLHGRIPELVLTSALIQPRDEVELIAWLRGLGAKGSHVQTVTIPTLANGAPQEASRGGGGLFGREKPAPSAPDSCDPAVFADWISIYLDLASTHREEASHA